MKRIASAPLSAPSPKKKLSERLLNMKFMRRAETPTNSTALVAPSSASLANTTPGKSRDVNHGSADTEKTTPSAGLFMPPKSLAGDKILSMNGNRESPATVRQTSEVLPGSIGSAVVDGVLGEGETHRILLKEDGRMEEIAGMLFCRTILGVCPELEGYGGRMKFGETVNKKHRGDSGTRDQRRSTPDRPKDSSSNYHNSGADSRPRPNGLQSQAVHHHHQGGGSVGHRRRRGTGANGSDRGGGGIGGGGGSGSSTRGAHSAHDGIGRHYEGSITESPRRRGNSSARERERKR